METISTARPDPQRSGSRTDEGTPSRIIPSGAIESCPDRSLSPVHWRADGTCRHFVTLRMTEGEFDNVSLAIRSWIYDLEERLEKPRSALAKRRRRKAKELEAMLDRWMLEL